LERLGSTCKSTGNLKDAIKYYKVVVEIREQYLSEEHPKLALSVFDLASVYDKIGDNTNALEYYKNAMSIHKKNFKNRSTNLFWYRKAELNIRRIEPLIKQDSAHPMDSLTLF
jgi:tetratricopeptide (TPR) repeat protein